MFICLISGVAERDSNPSIPAMEIVQTSFMRFGLFLCLRVRIWIPRFCPGKTSLGSA